ncbi:MAG: hypothetical protein IJK67_03740 [Bacilli bacterium]|nr:hypothetical protein [Bacilli bacterium]
MNKIKTEKTIDSKMIENKKSEINDLMKRLYSSECNYDVGCSNSTFGECTVIELFGVSVGVLTTYTADLVAGIMLWFVFKITSMTLYSIDEENKDNKTYNCMIQKYFSLIKSKIKKSNCKRKIKKLSNELRQMENKLTTEEQNTEEKKELDKPTEEMIKEPTKEIDKVISQKEVKIYPNGDFSHYFEEIDTKENQGPTLVKRK